MNERVGTFQFAVFNAYIDLTILFIEEVIVSVGIMRCESINQQLEIFKLLLYVVHLGAILLCGDGIRL